MLHGLVKSTTAKVIPILPLTAHDYSVWLKTQPARIKQIVASHSFSAEPNTFCLLLGNNGMLQKVLLGMDNYDDFYSFGVLPKKLPQGIYAIVAPNFSLQQLMHAALGWGMGSYRFLQYKTFSKLKVKLLCPKQCNFRTITDYLGTIFMVRDLINLPAGDLYPEILAKTAGELANQCDAKIKIIKGKELKENFPAVYSVGRGSKHEPLLIDLSWGDARDPKVVLVGKGVCFDSGGLQLKPANAMLLMKKDMAGAAHALGVARLVMRAKLPINLRVIIPVVENLISGDVLKPGDIIRTRKGLTVEVLNTDAEGRLILADALTLADQWHPQLIIDFATLTGAARVALGYEINALFANDEKLAADLITAMDQEQEALWQLPLYKPYAESLKGKLTDLKNIAGAEYVGGGAIVAALFLEKFVTQKTQWAHLDICAYNAISKPARPEGGEACCVRGVFQYLCQRFMSTTNLDH